MWRPRPAAHQVLNSASSTSRCSPLAPPSKCSTTHMCACSSAFRVLRRAYRWLDSERRLDILAVQQTGHRAQPVHDRCDGKDIMQVSIPVESELAGLPQCHSASPSHQMAAILHWRGARRSHVAYQTTQRPQILHVQLCVWRPGCT